MSKGPQQLERFIFWSRWLQAPLYLGLIVAQGTPDEIRASSDPFVHQFVYGEADGPVHFHYPAPPFESELMREKANG